MKKKVLIIRLTSLGDVIFTIPLANALKQNGYFVSYLTSEKGIDIIKNNPCVDKIHFYPLNQMRKKGFCFDNLKTLFNTIKEIRGEKYDIALDLQQMFKSLFLFWFSGAKRRITFKDARELSILGGNEFISPKHKFRDNNYHIIERNLDFARHLNIIVDEPIFTLSNADEATKAHVNELLKDVKESIAVIAPATTWKNKHWNNKNWRELIEKIKDKYSLVFTGMPNDAALIKEIGGDNFINLAGKTNLCDLKEVLSRATIVFTPDSGTAHLARALNKPKVVALFTCTPPKRFGVYSNKNKNKYFSLCGEMGCQPCFKKDCKFKTGACTNYPTVEHVLEIIEEK